MGASVRYRADRRAWWIYYRDGDKRWAEKIGPGEEGEREARRVAEAFNYELEQRDERKDLLRYGRERPFRVVAEAWWDARSTSMPASSQGSKKAVVYDRLIPFFGDVDTRDLNEDSVRACAVHMADVKGHARETVETTGSVLDTILRWAHRREILSAMPVPKRPGDKGIRKIFREVAAARCAPPKRPEAWTRNEVAALLSCAAERGPWLYAPMLFVAHTGCRRGEMIALEWPDVDLARARVTIRQSETRGQVKGTKADKVRTVELSPEVVKMLQGIELPTGRVFLDAKGKPWKDYQFSGYWVRVRKEAANKHEVRPLKFHCFRHTYATWALASGLDPAWCARQIGDTLEVFLSRYSHEMPGVVRSFSFLRLEPDAGQPRPDSAPPA